MPKNVKMTRKMLAPHPIESSEAFAAYLRRPEMRDPQSIERGVSRFLRELAPVRLDLVTPIHLEQGLQRLMGYGYNPSYVNKLLMQTRAFFAWCVAASYITKDPAILLRAPRVDRRNDVVVIPDEDVQKMTDYIKEHGTAEQCILWGALRMGARISEPCMATIADVRLDTARGCAFLYCRTKTRGRWARQPRWTFPYYVALVHAANGQRELPLLYLKGIPLEQRTARGQRVPNLGARTLAARNWLGEVQEAVFGERKWKPKDVRPTFLSKELAADPSKILMLADQVGNSVQVIQTNYLKHLQVPEFDSGEDD